MNDEQKQRVWAPGHADGIGNFLPTQHAAMVSGLSASTLAKRRMTGDGPPYFKVGRKVLYEKAALIAWLESHRRRNTSETGQ